MRKKREDWLRDVVQEIDYRGYLLFNLFKFKKCPGKIKRVVVVETYALGDLIVITPLLRVIKNNIPDAVIDVVVKPQWKGILEGLETVNEIIPYTSFSATKNVLKARKYDLGIILHEGSIKMSLLLLGAGVKYRIGCPKTGMRYGKGFFLHKKVKPNKKLQHKVQDILDMARLIDMYVPENMRPELPEVRSEKIRRQIKELKRPIIGIHVTSQHITQRWIPAYWIEVCNELIRKKKATLVFTGAPGEEGQVNQIIEKIEKKSAVVNMCGKTSVEEVIDLVRAYDLLITIDTSIIHIASATNTPTIALFGPTIPAIWGPLAAGSKVIWKEDSKCVGCRNTRRCVFDHDMECMRSITPKEVGEEAIKSLEQKESER